ncbi:hypothetical protein BOX15_Mlig006975g3 [Macrostomum lignano]|uniref:C2 domain-containing protein n=1 Tax=Macrostomum lignano TaxID=282301 RepID=A0A267FN86_9PLAT|nr:hypothetical protein BOX15_Mlig006975g3 [Macrostomum lignano]
MAQPAQQLLLHLLLLMLTTSLLTSQASSAAVKSSDKFEEELLQLRELIASELERRAAVRLEDGDSPALTDRKAPASLADVVAGAKAYASGLATSAAPPPPGTTLELKDEAVTPIWSNSSSRVNGTSPAGLFSPQWFAHLLTVMPLAAWIAVLCGAGLLLCALLALIIYCCCCRSKDFYDGSRQRLKRQDGYGMTFKDLDIVGKEQPPYGVINYSLEYDVPSCELIITATSCIGLPKDLKQLDPYLVMHVSQDSIAGKKKHRSHSAGQTSERSKIVKNTVNPAFNYTRVVKIRDKRLLRRTVIKFEIYDYDIGSRHQMIARRELKLAKLGEKLDDILGRKVEYTKNLKAGINEEANGPGDICLALCYSTMDKLNKYLWVHVIECKGVFIQRFGEPDFDTLPNTYVKLALHVPGSRRTIQSTKLIKASRNPYFNEQFIFKTELSEYISLRVSLMHRSETLGIKRVIGSQTLSMQADKDSIERLHWRDVLEKQDIPSARWHSLVTPEDERKTTERKEAEERKRKLERAEDEAAAAAALYQ